MRTTVTLDPDVEQLLRQAMALNDESFKTTLNRAVRRGLASLVSQADPERFVVAARPMAVRSGNDPTRLGQLNDDLEVDAFLRVTRQLTDRP